MSGTPRRPVTIWKNKAEELFKSLLFKKNNLCFSQFAHCFGFSWLIFQGLKIISLVLCCPLAPTGVVKKTYMCQNTLTEWVSSSLWSIKTCIRMHQAEVSLGRWYGPGTVLNPACKFSVLRCAGQYSVPPLSSCPMTWSTVQVLQDGQSVSPCVQHSE